MSLWMILLPAAITAACLMAGRTLFHYFQLESYQFPGYFRTLGRNPGKAFLPGLILNAVLVGSMAVCAVVIPPENDWLPSVITIVLVLCAGWLIRRHMKKIKAKKPMNMTARMKRLYCVAGILFLAVLVICSRLGGFGSGIGSGILSGILILFPVFLPLWVALAGLLAWPIEKGISELYFRDAQRILRERKDLIRIGITGSWGKTSVKFILGTMLEEKYHTLITPASFNTPMGVTKVIRSRLEPGHRVFVAEMGARHVGDIREMCRLVHPQMGLLTSVGPQHLDTFHTLERIISTKYELMDAIPADGHCFFADDGDIVRKLWEKTEKAKTLTGLDPEADDVWAEEIRVDGTGSSFTLCTKDIRIPCRTRLLGELNIRNILLCAGVCLQLGMTGEQIARGIGKIAPVEHRLQLIPNPGGMTVIDDAFNSNIRGAEQAFRVLKEMPGTRYLITPGMVELGSQEEELNREFGKMAAECCDVAILIGKKRSEAIARGMTGNGFPKEKILVAGSLEEATAMMRRSVRAGDTVLFENDLPDNYSE